MNRLKRSEHSQYINNMDFIMVLVRINTDDVLSVVENETMSAKEESTVCSRV